MALHPADIALLRRVQAEERVKADALIGDDLLRANRLVKRGVLSRPHDDHYAFKLSLAGAATLADGGRLEKPGRVYCLNPKCGRTDCATKFNEIVCSSCWKLLPRDLTVAYRDLKSLKRKLERRRAKSVDGIVEVPLSAIGMERRISANWSAIRDFFLAPAKPEGLETFLEEMGWTEAAPSP